MKTTHKEALIKGIFTPEQAREVLTTLFRSKIQMHTLSSFSTYVKTGKESGVDNTRKQELIGSLERLVKSLQTMNDPELDVKLDCMVKMEFVTRKLKRK